MSLKLRIACAALLAATTLPAFALQLGEIQVKSALNQPLVAAIPLHPKNLTELDGMTVGLASAEDFSRAGLTLTSTDRTLRFHLVTDNNGQKLILVTSTEPVTDPYLDFIVEVNTREGKQVREFVALLNPVIEAPAPAIQEAPVARSPAVQPATPQPAELPPASAFAQPAGEPGGQPAKAVQRPSQPPAPAAPAQAAAAPASHAGGIEVRRGDTLSGIAGRVTRGTAVDVNRMMLALQAVNPDAFFKHNINNLKAGAILRMPTQDEIDQRSAAVAAVEVHRQVEAWRAAKPQAATLVAGSAAEAAVGPAAPAPASASRSSDHLTLAPASGKAEAGAGGAAAAGGVGAGARSATEASADRDSLISLNQSNADLAARVHDLDALSAKTDKLLSLKDATIAELQRKLAQSQAAKAGPAGRAAAAAPQGAAPAVAGKPRTAAVPTPKAKSPRYARPIAWIVLGLVVFALLVAGLLRRRRGDDAPVGTRGPLHDPDDVGAESAVLPSDPALAGGPDDPRPIEPHAALDPDERETLETGGVAADAGTGLEALSADEPVALVEPVADADATPAAAPVLPGSEAGYGGHPGAPAALADEASGASASAPFLTGNEAGYVDDPVDTKLDLARAYLDLDDSANARAMLEEVIEEGSQMQKDEAKRLLADVAG